MQSGLVTKVVAADMVWTYNAFFLVLALVPTVTIGLRLLGNFDTLATLIVARVGTAECDAGEN